MKKKLGRPKKAPEESLTEIIPVRMTRAERELCEEAAKRADRKVTAWIREKATKAARREVKVVGEPGNRTQPA